MGKTGVLELIIDRLRRKHPQGVIVTATNGKFPTIYTTHLHCSLFSDATAFRLAGVQLDHLIGAISPNNTPSKIAKALLRQPNIKELWLHARALVIDDG